METSADTKTLLLLRHAKSREDDQGPDHERTLSGRGRRDAVAVGELLSSRGIVPDIVACSTAERTRETWDRAVKGGARAHQIRYLDDIYLARVTELVRLVRTLPEEASTVLMIGHSPGTGDLVEFLAARTAGSDAWARLDRKYPTAGLATLTVTGPWAQAGESRAELVAFDVPRGERASQSDSPR